MLEICVELDQRVFAEFLINGIELFSPDFCFEGVDDTIDGLKPTMHFLILAAALSWAPGLDELRHLLENLASPS